ncbi:MAG: Gfo/Idh/MocA family oxidoreductase, partial [Kiritimatiellaeota bacterium]|nr:Gfo/Idh/MocA family oxidoreductase [Kiritimatiellota bacterium]
MPKIAFISVAHIHSKGFCEAVCKLTSGKAPAVIWDENPERGKKYAADFNCPYEPDLDKVLADPSVDGFVITAENTRHLPLLRKVLPVGKPVLCEKPLAKTAAEVDELIIASKRSGKLLAIFQQSRFAPHFMEITRVIESGVLGRIVQVSIEANGFARRWDWQTVQMFNAGSLYNTGPHPVDLALRFLDCDGTPEIKCYMDRVNTFGDAEDYVKLLISAPGRPVVDVEISSCNMYPTHAINIHAEYGGLKATQDHIEYKYYSPSEAPKQKLIIEPLEQPDGTPAYCGEKLE